VSVISIVPKARRNRSGGLWFPGDLALDLLSEFQGPGNLRKNFGRPTRAPHDDCSIAQEPSERRLLDGDAFDSWQKKLDRAAIDDPRLYDDSFIGDGHFRGAAPHETNAEKNRGYQPTGNAHPSQRAGKRSSSGVYSACRGKERGRTHQREDGGDQSVPHHDDPVQPGLVLYGFARDEMLFGVAQMGSLKKGVSKLAIGEAAADDGPKLRLVNCHSCKTEKISNSVGSANGNRTRILALKGRKTIHISSQI